MPELAVLTEDNLRNAIRTRTSGTPPKASSAPLAAVWGKNSHFLRSHVSRLMDCTYLGLVYYRVFRSLLDSNVEPSPAKKPHPLFVVLSLDQSGTALPARGIIVVAENLP